MQEFAEDSESCFKASGDCYFEVWAIEKRLAEMTEPIGTEGAQWIWFSPVAESEYLIAVDTAGGGPDGDFTRYRG